MNAQSFRDTRFPTSLLEEADGDGHNPTGNPTMGDIIAARFSRRSVFEGFACRLRASRATVSPLVAARAADRARGRGWRIATKYCVMTFS